MLTLTAPALRHTTSTTLALLTLLGAVGQGVLMLLGSILLLGTLARRGIFGQIAKVSKIDVRDTDGVLFWMYERRAADFNSPERLCVMGAVFEFR